MRVQIKSNVSAMNKAYEREVLIPAKIKAQTYAKNKTLKSAQAIQREWQRKFKRKTPKNPKSNRRELEMLDENLNPLNMTVREFIKEVKKKKSKHFGQFLEVGELGKRQTFRKESLDRNRAIRQKESNLVKELSGKKVSKRERSLESNLNWTEYALKKETSWIEKSPNSTPGSWPFTWKNIERGLEGSSKRNIPDYYLKNKIKIKKDGDAWIVYISPYFSGDKTRKIFDVLEHGGTIYKRFKYFVGYQLKYYRLSARQGDRRGMKPGRKMGRNRRRIVPIIENRKQMIYVSARPFIRPMEEEIKKRKL